MNVLKPETDFLADLDRACEAAARGDFRDAARWTGLAERKLAMARKLCDTALKAGWKPDMIKYLKEARSAEEEKPEAPDTALPDQNPQDA